MSLINEALKQAGNETRRKPDDSVTERMTAARRARIGAGAGRAMMIAGIAVCALIVITGIATGLVFLFSYLANAGMVAANDPSQAIAAASESMAPSAVKDDKNTAHLAAPLQPFAESEPTVNVPEETPAVGASGSTEQPVKTPLITGPLTTTATGLGSETGDRVTVGNQENSTPHAYQNYVVKAILKGAGNYMALLNSRMVKKGDRLDIHTVVSNIDADSVTLDIEGVRYRIGLALPTTDQ